MIEEGVLTIDLGGIEDTVDKLHLGKACAGDRNVFDLGKLSEKIGVRKDLVKLRNPSVAVGQSHLNERVIALTS